MKKVMAALVLVAACHRSVSTSPTPSATVAAQTQIGASDAPGAVRAFLAAAHDQDLQAMGAAWGTVKGPVRDQMPRDEMEKRELIMLKCLQHDSYEILSNSPSTTGQRLLAVQLKRRNLTHSWDFTTVAGPNNRWYVLEFNMDLTDAFCRS